MVAIAFKKSDFPSRRAQAACANLVGNPHKLKMSSARRANFSNAVSTLSRKAANVGKYTKCVSSCLICFQSFSIGL